VEKNNSKYRKGGKKKASKEGGGKIPIHHQLTEDYGHKSQVCADLESAPSREDAQVFNSAKSTERWRRKKEKIPN